VAATSVLSEHGRVNGGDRCPLLRARAPSNFDRGRAVLLRKRGQRRVGTEGGDARWHEGVVGGGMQVRCAVGAQNEMSGVDRAAGRTRTG
jgi:hypothetical protein